jgi:hypothetical protein
MKKSVHTQSLSDNDEDVVDEDKTHFLDVDAELKKLERASSNSHLARLQDLFPVELGRRALFPPNSNIVQGKKIRFGFPSISSRP